MDDASCGWGCPSPQSLQQTFTRRHKRYSEHSHSHFLSDSRHTALSQLCILKSQRSIGGKTKVLALHRDVDVLHKHGLKYHIHALQIMQSKSCLQYLCQDE